MIPVSCMSACRCFEKGRALEARALLTGVLLAGGRGQRMGGCDKGLVSLAGEPLIAQGIRRLRPQVAELLISANRHVEQYRQWGYRVISDRMEERYRGPLAGLLAALDVATTPYVLTAPCDSPLLPPDYAARMWTALQDAHATVSVAYGAGSWQPVFALVAVSVRDDLAAWLAAEEGGMKRWLQRHRPAVVVFPDQPGGWRNVNTPQHLAQLEAEWCDLTGRPGGSSRA